MGEDTADDDALTCKLITGLSRLSLREFHLKAVAAQTLDDLEILLIVEICDDALCHHLTDAFYLLQLFYACIH